MTLEEAIKSLRSRGFYVKATDDGGFRGGTSRTQEGFLGIVHNAFYVWPQEGNKWFVRHENKGQLSIDHTCDTIEDALKQVEDYLDKRLAIRDAQNGSALQ